MGFPVQSGAGLPGIVNSIVKTLLRRKVLTKLYDSCGLIIYVQFTDTEDYPNVLHCLGTQVNAVKSA